MDALRRDSAILRGLLLAGPGITIALLPFVFLAVLLGLSLDEKGVEAFHTCMLFPVVGLVARAATRVRLYCDSAGQLGIPRHAPAMRRAQIIVIGLFTLLPISFALWMGAGFRAVTIFVGGTAFAIYIAEAISLVLFAALALRGLAAAGVDVWDLIFGVPGTVLILAASVWGMLRWLSLPQRLEAEAAAAPRTFADLAHEDLNAEELDAANEAFEHHLDDVLAPRAPQVLAPRRLWIGLSYDPRVHWRANALGIFLALVIVVVFHYLKHARVDLVVYLVMSAFFATFVFARFQRMNEAWLRTPGEQSLLVLSAHWPARRDLRIVLLRSVWTGIPELLAGWALFSGVVLAIGWIDWRTIMLTAIGQGAVLASSLGILVSYFAYSRIRRTNLFPMAYLLIALGGIATLLTSMANDYRTGMFIGAGLLAAPAAVAFLAFFLRPVLFPVQIDIRK